MNSPSAASDPTSSHVRVARLQRLPRRAVCKDQVKACPMGGACTRSCFDGPVVDPSHRATSAQDSSPRRSSVSSKRWTDSPAPRPSPSSYPMDKRTHCSICACSRSSSGSTPCSVSSSSSPMHSWVRSFVLARCMDVDVSADHDERIPLFSRTAQSDPDLPYHPLMRCATTLFCDRTSLSHCYSGR